MKFGSDFSIVNKGLTIDIEDSDKNPLNFDRKYIIDLIDRVSLENNKIFMLKDLPIRLEDIRSSDSIKSDFNNMKHFIVEDYIGKLIEHNDMGYLTDGIILSSFECAYKKFIARNSYEYAIKNATFKLKNLDNIDKFLTINRIFTKQRLDSSLLKHNKFKSFLFVHKKDYDKFSNLQKIYSNGNALLLFLNMNNYVGVFN